MGRITRVQRTAPTLELYAKAAAGSVLPGAVWGGGTELPDETLERLVAGDPEQVAAYNEVCGFAAADPLPITYPHLLGFPLSLQLMSARGFPLPMLGMVHVTNAITVHRPVPAAEDLLVSVRAAGPFPHRRGAEVDLITEVHQDDALLWEETTTYLARGSEIASGEPRPRVEWPIPSSRAHIREVRIGGDIGRRYGSVSGDRNPIHINTIGARAFGFKRPIAHGMWMLANCLAVAGLSFRPPYRVSTAFRKPVPIPGQVRLLTATEQGQLRIWLTGPTAEQVHLVTTVDRIGE